jgi:hypothetical protein
VVLNWERIAFRTVYTDAATPIPVGVPVLGFTSLAIHRAVQASLSRGRASSERAAVIASAYQVLQHYYPKLRGKLLADRAASLESVQPGPARRFGVKVGKRAARGLIEERRDDGYLDATIHYSKPPGPGVWQPAPGGDMLAAWIGSLKRLVVRKTVRVDGPDALTSAAYTAQFEEVKSLGQSTSTTRTAAQTQTALFFNSNSATMVGDALTRYLEQHPMTMAETARLFAAMHAAMTDSLIQCWRLKRDVGFWRPSQAIQGAATDGNPATNPSATPWTPLIPNPPYSDYVSGHGCLTGPAVEVIRQTLGEHTLLELISVNSPTHRTYPTLRGLEQEAFNARIWSGLHFRTAMEDAYRIGHVTARRVLKALD